DIAEYCQLPVILVTPDRLGTISATLSAIEIILNRGLRLDAVFLNTRPEDHTTAHQPDNITPLRYWCDRLFPEWSGQILRFTDGHTALCALNKPNKG
ncbi:MAG TPA: hypothetical protein ENM98_04685, partial [Halothiobacillaceae bacterium]|nr:hypothetical protein [Halothiobacillaceae bacterium]